MSRHARVRGDAGAAAEHPGLWQLSSFPVPETGADLGCAAAAGFTGPTGWACVRAINSGISAHQEMESNKSILKSEEKSGICSNSSSP